MANKQTQTRQDDEEDFEDLMQDDEEVDELAELENQEEEAIESPNLPRRLPPQVAKQVKATQREAKRVQQVTDRATVQQARRPVPKPAQVTQPVEQPRPFAALMQPERVVVAFSNTGEPIAEGMPLWAAQMWADIKNDLSELRDAIGKM